MEGSNRAIKLKRASVLERQNAGMMDRVDIRDSLNKVSTNFFFEVSMYDENHQFNGTKGMIELKRNEMLFVKENDENSRQIVIMPLDRITCGNVNSFSFFGKSSKPDDLSIQIVSYVSHTSEERSIQVQLKFTNRESFVNFLKTMKREAIVNNVLGFMCENNMEELVHVDRQQFGSSPLNSNNDASSSSDNVLLSDDGMSSSGVYLNIISSGNELKRTEQYIAEVFEKAKKTGVACCTNSALELRELKTILRKLDPDASNVNTLDLSNTPIGVNGSILLEAFMHSNTTVTTLILSNCNLGDEGARRIGDALLINKTITSINLDANGIDFFGCSAIASSLVGNCTLKALSLGGNRVGPKGAAALANSLGCDLDDTCNATLTYLNLNHQTKGMKIGPYGASQLAHALRNPKCGLTTLKIGRNNILFEGGRHISAALFSNNTLLELDVGGIQYMTIAGSMQLALALLNNVKLETLVIGNFRIPLFAIRGFDHIHLDERGVSVLTSPPEHVEIVDNGIVINSRDGKILNLAMQDEMAILVGHLLLENRVLKTLTIKDPRAEDPRDQTVVLPIQELRGNDLFHGEIVTSLDLSNRGYKSIHAIIIGVLIAYNENLTDLNLGGNKFGNTEGENYVAFGLKKNPKISLDTTAWPTSAMFVENYKALCSLLGVSASGATLEPQRLEFWFYRSLTVCSGLMFYIGLGSDINAIYVMASDEIFPRSYWWISLLLLLLPTVLVSINSGRNWFQHDVIRGLYEQVITILQLSSFSQAYYSVIHSVETAEMLDYKFVQGVYRQLPGIAFQTYILFYMCVTQRVFSWSVLIAIFSSLVGTVVIFIMLYDRIQARRMAMLPPETQPYIAVIIADLFSIFGMGVNDETVSMIINFDAFYTSHYTVAYINQLFSIVSRIVTVTWFLAVVGTSWLSILAVSYCFLSRILLIYGIDKNACARPFVTNLVNAVSLMISDSAWLHETYEDEEEENYTNYNCCNNNFIRRAWETSFLQIMIITSVENVFILLVNVFYLSEYYNSGISYYDGSIIMMVMFLIMFLRWLLIFHWVLPTHFHVFKGTDNRGDIKADNFRKKQESDRAIRNSEGSAKSPRRRNMYVDVSGDFSNKV